MAIADTPRKRLGLGIIISHLLGLVVGFVVYFTMATPSVVPVLVVFIITLLGSLFTDIVIKQPDIPE